MGEAVRRQSHLGRASLGDRKRETCIDRFQRTKAPQSQFEHPLLDGGIIQHLDNLPASHTDAHLFSGREGDRVNAHGIEVIDTFL